MFATPTIENQRRLRALGQPPNHEPLNFNLPMQDDILRGLCSFFGGPNDLTMKDDDGLSLYEPAEADLRPDLFVPAPTQIPNLETWKRLRPEAPYVSMRWLTSVPRRTLQRLLLCVRNPRNSRFAFGFPVDRGPGRMDKLIDLSPRFKLLGLESGQEVEVSLALPGPMGLKALTSWVPGTS